jgi:hypothetical protein
MSKEREITRQLKKLMENEIQTFPAKVTAIDKDEKTITVIDRHSIEYDDVRLSSIIEGGDKIVSYPKQDSWVLVSIINNVENELFVTAFSEVEEIEGKIATTEYIINADGFKIDRDGENLKEVHNDLIAEIGKLCDELAKVVVSIGVTPNVPAINKIKQEVTGTIKNRLNTILK